MSRGLNKVMLIGNLGGDPEMHYTSSGSAVANFNIATSRSWKSPNGEARSETEWFRVVAWGKLGEICKEYLHKGQQVYIEGRLQTRKWEDKDGVKRSTVEVVANEMTMLGGKRDKNQYEDNSSEDSPPDINIDEDEFPF